MIHDEAGVTSVGRRVLPAKVKRCPLGGTARCWKLNKANTLPSLYRTSIVRSEEAVGEAERWLQSPRIKGGTEKAGKQLLHSWHWTEGGEDTEECVRHTGTCAVKAQSSK